MTKINVLNRDAASVGEIELIDEMFLAQVNVPLMHQAVKVYLASQRRGTHSVKTRAAVSGGGKKPWRQKGTGRASFGSSRNPVWRGGGVAFGPVTRDHSITMPKKMRRAALLSALSSKLADGSIIVIDDLAMDEPKTKEMARIMKNVGAANALVVLNDEAYEAALSLRNMPGFEAVPFDGMNTYNILYHDKLVITKEALAMIEEVYA